MVFIIVATVIKAELLLAHFRSFVIIFTESIEQLTFPFLLPLPVYATRKNCAQLNLIAPSFNCLHEDVMLCTFTPPV